MPSRPLHVALLVLLCLVASRAVAAGGEELEVVELIPEDRAGATASHFFAPITGLFLGGPGYWYSDRKVKIDTTPPGAALDLFYVRRNFQKGYEQADAPVMVVLPRRIDTADRDSLTVRAFLDGYRQKEVTLSVRSKQEEIHIELEPLANELVGVTHLYLAGRSSVSFLTEEALTFRVQKREGGYSLVLLETGATSEAKAAMSAVRDGLVASLGPQQLGEDLVVQLALTEAASRGDLDVRQRQSYDPIRRVHSFTVDIAPVGGPSSVQLARQALARIDAGAIGGCAMRFDAELRQQLDPAALARALTPKGAFQDPYLRAALKRLGEVSPSGGVTLVDGTRYQTSVPLELAAASSQAAEVQGYLAVLRSFVAELEPAPYRRGTLRGLVAPTVGPSDFEQMMDRAETAERSCLAAAR
jgi:hypothetical protein